MNLPTCVIAAILAVIAVSWFLVDFIKNLKDK